MESPLPQQQQQEDPNGRQVPPLHNDEEDRPLTAPTIQRPAPLPQTTNRNLAVSFSNPKIASTKLLEQLRVTATYLFIGIALLIVSIVLIVRSNHVFIGGIVPGALAIVIGIIGFVIDQKKDYVWFLLSTLVLVCALIFSILQGISFGQVNQLEACAEYTNELIVSCQGGALEYYECTGNTDYYSNAQYCAAFYKDGEEDQVCGCVRSESSVCVIFNGITDCSILIDEVPELLLTSFIFSVFLTLIALMSFIIRLYYFPPRLWRKNISNGGGGVPSSALTYENNNDNALPRIEEENDDNEFMGLDSPGKMVSDDSEVRYKPTHEIHI